MVLQPSAPACRHDGVPVGEVAADHIEDESDDLRGAVSREAADRERQHEGDRTIPAERREGLHGPAGPRTEDTDDDQRQQCADPIKAEPPRRPWQAREQRIGPGGVEAPVEDLEIEIHPPPRGVRLDATRAQEIGRNQRRDHARDEQAHQHRHDDGKSERLEILTGDARHQRDGQEDRDDGHRGREHGEADFVGSVKRCLIGGLAHAHVPNDIFYLDDCIIDEDAGNQAHGHGRHEIERDSEQAHEPEGGDR